MRKSKDEMLGAVTAALLAGVNLGLSVATWVLVGFSGIVVILGLIGLFVGFCGFMSGYEAIKIAKFEQRILDSQGAFFSSRTFSSRTL